MTNNIIFNKKHSLNDMQLIRIKSTEHKHPSKIKVKEKIPFMNGEYDFSNLYNCSCYEERKLTYSFLVEVDEVFKMNYKKIEIENWLMGTNQKSKLIDERLKGYYYLAECTDINFENYYSFGLIDVTFTAYPFKIGEAYEGNNLWDSFNFELDVLQDTKFTVNGSSSVNIYNSSAIDIEPAIIASSEFEIIKDSKKFIVEAGESKDYRFKLKKGENNITLKGNGTIEFRFRKEVL